jgi:hypothetical protein
MDENLKRPLVMVIALVVIIGSGVWIYLRGFRDPQPKINPSPLQALGQITAEEVVKLTGGSGTVVVIGWDKKMTRLPTFAIPQEAFETALKQHPGLQLAAVEAVTIDAQGGFGMQMGPPPDRFLDILAQHADATVVVSFVGMPALGDQHYARLPSPRPKIVAVANGPMAMRAMFERGVIDEAVAPLFRPPTPDRATKNPQTPREWFDRYYQVITSENYQDYPG